MHVISARLTRVRARPTAVTMILMGLPAVQVATTYTAPQDVTPIP